MTTTNSADLNLIDHFWILFFTSSLEIKIPVTMRDPLRLMLDAFSTLTPLPAVLLRTRLPRLIQLRSKLPLLATGDLLVPLSTTETACATDLWFLILEIRHYIPIEALVRMLRRRYSTNMNVSANTDPRNTPTAINPTNLSPSFIFYSLPNRQTSLSEKL